MANAHDGTTAPPLRVGIAEDDDLLRDLLRRTLATQHGIVVHGAFESGTAALAGMPPLRLDAVLLDIDLGPGPTGIELGRALRAEQPRLGVVLLSQYRVPRALELLDHARGGVGYLLKGSVADAAIVAHALRAVAAGRVALDPALTAVRRAAGDDDLARLTPRQLDVLRLVAEGWSNGAIAARLALSEKTIENQLNAVYAALDVGGDADGNRRVRAVLRWLELSLPGGPGAAGEARAAREPRAGDEAAGRP